MFTTKFNGTDFRTVKLFVVKCFTFESKNFDIKFPLYIGPGLAPADVTTHKYLEQIAIGVAKDLATDKMKMPKRGPKNNMQKLTAAALKYDFVKNIVFDKAKGQVMKQTNGLYPAPLKILEVVRNGLDKGLGSAEGYKAEHEGFGALAATFESNALIGLFHGQTECKKNKFGKPAKPTK